MTNPNFSKRIIKAHGGTDLHCKNWQIEAAWRMIQHNLDPENAEHPEKLVVYGGIGKAARNHESLEGILSTLENMDIDETLLVQSGKPVGVARTYEDAPKVIIANSNLVPNWANWDEFRRLDELGLMMYGQMTAGSWIYIGTQGILQGTYETIAECARQHFGGSLAGKFLLTGGMGGMGGAQPLAATFAGAVSITVEIDETRIDKRIKDGYCDEKIYDLDEALKRVEECKSSEKAWSIGLVGNTADILPQLYQMGVVPDVVTDQTSAHDPLNGYYPSGYTKDEADQLRISNPEKYLEEAHKSITTHVKAMVAFKDKGSIVFDYGNNIRGVARDEGGYKRAFDFKGFVPEYIRPLFCDGNGPFRWVALSGDPQDIYTTDDAIKNLFPEKEDLHRWIDNARKHVGWQGFPSRICWLGFEERRKAGLMFNELVRTGKVAAPIVIGRDHLDCGSVASPHRETEAMKDGSDAVSDWVMLNFALNAVGGATWVSLHHGGGVGMGMSQHAGMVVVADGTDAADGRLSRVLTYDPLMGILRHTDAGYQRASDNAKKHGIQIPLG
jgi:urocanate hydratase